MRFYGLALTASAAVLAACGGGGDKAKDSTTTANTAAPAPTPGAPGGTGASAPGGVAKVAATGQTVDVKMVGDDKGYRFEPADIKIKSGDAVRFTMVSGGPHNVSFDPATITDAGSKAQ